LRDIVVTEYGVADLRDKSDAEVMSALINIADSRFQKQLLAKAKDAKKIPDDYEIPGAWHDNSPDRIRNTLSASRRSGKLPAFPLGSGLTDVEEHLAQGLAQLAPKAGDVGSMAALALQGIRRPVSDRMEKALARMQLDQPKGFKEQLYRALLVAVLEE
jgi:hypothetical protein